MESGDWAAAGRVGLMRNSVFFGFLAGVLFGGGNGTLRLGGGGWNLLV